MKQLINEAIDLLEILHHEPAVSEALSLLRSAQSQLAADDKAGGEVAGYVYRWSDGHESLEYSYRNGNYPRESIPYYTRHQPQAIPAGYAPDIDWLSNVIRQADGNKKLGAGALAESIVNAMIAAAPKVK